METKESIVIREAVHVSPYNADNDYAYISRFQVACCLETEQRDLVATEVQAGVVNILEHKELGLYFVVEHVSDKGVKTVIGCCLIQPQFSDWNCAYYVCLESVYIAPEFRKKGILQSLFEHIERYAKERFGYGEIRANVSRANVAMQKAMEKIGCKELVYKVYSKGF